MEASKMPNAYADLINLLEDHGIQYRLIEHPPEGRTELVSQLRGHALNEAAKCMIVMVKLDRESTKHVLGVVPGDQRVDLSSIKMLFNARYVSFASAEVAEALAGCVSGAILPFSFNRDLEVIADPSLLQHEWLYFNAARLDRSMVITTKDYLQVAKPRLLPIAQDRATST
jgi:Ala-tRNA(Pro) deacylase